MPSRRHNAAIDSSPRRPSSTMRIFSSAPYCLRVARRMSFATCSAEAFCVPAFCLIFAPLKGYDEPEILPSQLSRFCLIGADAGHESLRPLQLSKLFKAADLRGFCVFRVVELAATRMPFPGEGYKRVTGSAKRSSVKSQRRRNAEEFDPTVRNWFNNDFPAPEQS